MQGTELNINADFLNRLDKAEKHLEKLAQTSENTLSVMMNLSGKGIQSVVDGLEKVNNEIKKISFGNITTQASQSVDAINKMVETLAKMTTLNQMRVEKLGKEYQYIQEKNALKEVIEVEKERTREIERQAATDKKLDKQRQSLLTKKLANDTRELMNAEKDRERQLMLSEIKNEATYKKEQLKVKQLKAEVDRLAKAYKAMPTVLKQADFNKMFKESVKAKSINQRIVAIHNLQNALNDLDTKSKKYAENVKKINDEIKRQKAELTQLGVKFKDVANKSKEANNVYKKSGDILEKLRHRLMLVFSIQRIIGYVKKITAVRKEFELQNRSLQIILQNKEAANKLWAQTIELAVHSPFKIKELVTYTKQLAAYRIEEDKLHDTTKRLADVSAGLGVDMNRLILAYGQVRAANYLRGTELRQFTEAGIPLLDELAKHFTELEGKAISAGDVFGMISKRMVSFADVADVFKKMTDEGGVFFEMQEQQAKTLHGLLSNLQDTVDLMINEIGVANDAGIKGAVESVRELVIHWRNLLDVTNQLKPVIYAAIGWWVAYRLSMTKVGVSMNNFIMNTRKMKGVMLTFNKEMQLAAGSTKRYAITMGAAGKMIAGSVRFLSGVAAGAAGVIGTLLVGKLIEYIYTSREAEVRAEQLANAFSRVESELGKDLQEGVGAYQRLATTLKDVTRSYTEREEAMQKLKRMFGDILPDQYLELDYIQKTTDGYKEATDALKLYYNEKAREQKIDKINETYSETITKSIENIVKGLDTSYVEKSSSGAAETMYDKLTAKYKLDTKGLNQITNAVVDDIKRGIIDVDDLYKELFAKINKYYGVNIKESDISGRLRSYVFSLRDDLKEYTDEIEGVSGLPAETKVEAEQIKTHRQQLKLLDEQKVKVDELRNAYSEYYKLLKLYNKDGVIGDTEQSKLTDAKDSIKKKYEGLGLVFDEKRFSEAIKSTHDLNAEIINISKTVYKDFTNKTGTSLIQQTAEDVEKLLDTLDGTELQQNIELLMRSTASQFEIPMSAFDKLKMDAKDSLDDMRKRTKEHIEDMKELVKKFNIALAETPSMMTTEGWQKTVEENLSISKAEIDQISNSFIPAWTFFLARLGSGLDNNKGRGAGKDWMSELIKGIKEAHKEYISLNKTLDETESKRMALAKYADVVAVSAKNAGISGVSLGELKFTTEQGTIEALEMLRDKLPESAKQARLNIEKALADIRGELRITTKKDEDKALMDSIESLFSNYEISLELDELNIPADLQKQIFNVGHMSLKDLRQSLEAHKSLFVGKDMESEYDKFLKKLEDMEDKALHERAKKYSKYLAKSMSETVKMKLEEQRAIAEIDSLNVSDDVKESMRQGVRQETQKKIEKQQWTDFKETDLYIEMFEDLDAVSYRTLKRMKEELTKMRDSLKNLDPSELKEIVSQIEKIDKEMMDKKPLEGFASNVWNYFKNLKKYKEAEKETFDAQEYYNSTKKNIDNLQLEIEDAKTNGDYERVESLEQELVFEKSLLDIYKKQLKIANAKKNEAKESVNTTKEQIQKVGSYISEAANALPQLMGNLQSMGVNVSDSTRDTIESISEIAGGVGSAIQGFASGNYVQGILGVTQAISGIFKIGDKKKEREIQKQIELVDRLQHAYEKLERAIENSYSINTLQASMDLAESNLKEQITATEKMIKAEEDKKDTDHERIKEWEREIESMKEQLEELENQRVESLGGIGGEEEYKSAAESFVDAWLSAYQETGDGLRGLEEEFDEVMRNLIKKQITLRAAQGYLEPLFKQIDKAVGRDSDIMLSAEEVVSNLQNMEGNIDSTMSDLNDMLSYLAQQYDIGDWIEGSSNLSGLQKGIQGVTEDTADIIASYLNSIRFFVAEKHSMLSQIADAFTNVDAPNPMLMELRIQTDLVRSINDMFGSVIGRGDSTHTGAYLKVKM